MVLRILIRLKSVMQILEWQLVQIQIFRICKRHQHDFNGMEYISSGYDGTFAGRIDIWRFYHLASAGKSVRLSADVYERYFVGVNSADVAGIVEEALSAWFGKGRGGWCFGRKKLRNWIGFILTLSWQRIMMWRSSQRIRGISGISITRSIRERGSALFSINIRHPIRTTSTAGPGICGRRGRASRCMMCYLIFDKFLESPFH